MFRRLAVMLIFFLSLFMALIPVVAQENLNEEFVSYDNWLVFNYPSGWILNADGDDFGVGFLMLASSSKALQTIRTNGDNNQSKPVPAGEVGIIVMRSRYLNKLLKLTAETTPSEVLKQFLGASLSLTSGDIQTLTIAGYPAARLDSSDKKSTGVFLLVDFGYNERILIVSTTAPKDMDKFEPTLLAIANSLRFGGAARKLLIHNNPVWQVAWSLDGRYLATREKDAKSKQNIVHVWDASNFEELYQAPADGFDWNPDSQHLLVWEVDTSTRILDAITGQVLATLPRASNASWSADGKRLLTTSYQDKNFKVWDITVLPPPKSDQYKREYISCALG